MIDNTFHDIEYRAWSERASYYDDIFAHISSQAIAPILNSYGDLQGKHHLDVACGTGHLVAAAAMRGAISMGIDFAETMIQVARANHPAHRFEVGNALNLPYEDGSFDVVTCAFGLLHLEYPQQAIAEAFRVLKAGGQFIFTLWYNNDEQGLTALVKPALSGYNVFTLPESWTQLKHADPAVCTQLTSDAGFELAQFADLPITWQVTDTSMVVDFVQRLSVRTKLVIESQPENIRQKIYERILAEADARKVDGVFEMGWSALLTHVQKPE